MGSFDYGTIPQVPTAALDYAKSIGLDRASTEGYGAGYVRNAMLSAMPAIREKLNRGMGSISARRDVQFGGASSSAFSTMEDMVSEEAATELGSTIFDAENQNAAYAGQAASQMLGIYSQQDAMNMQREIAIEQMKIQEQLNKPSWHQLLFKGLTTAALLTSGVGVPR